MFVINALLQYFFKCVSIHTHSLKLYTLYRELILLTIIKQSSYPTEYISGLMMQIKSKLTDRYIYKTFELGLLLYLLHVNNILKLFAFITTLCKFDFLIGNLIKISNKLQGLVQRMRLRRLLYGIYTVFYS